MRSNAIRTILYLSASAAALLHTPAQAQTVGPSQEQSQASDTVEEIVVTAEKRESTVQTTALAIATVSGDALKTRQVTDVQALAQSLPNVNFGVSVGNARVAIRGVGFDNISVGNEGRVAFHLDGVYVSRPAAVLGNFYDVERVEVVRGPQGTLYGRNATAGAVNILTANPTEQFSGYVTLGGGNYGAVRAEGAVGGPIASGVSVRLSAQAIDHDGYGKNRTNGLDVDDQNTRAIRGKLRFEPASNFQLLLSADYMRERDHAYGYHLLGSGSTLKPLTGPLFGGAVPSDPRDSTSDVGPSNDRTFYGFGGEADWDLGTVQIKSITAYRSSRFTTTTDLDVTSANLTYFVQQESSKHFSEELRASGRIGAADWMIGGYYFDERLVGGTAIALSRAVVGGPLAGLTQGFFAFGRLHTQAYAGFGQLRYPITDTLTLSLGGRYSSETKSIDEANKLDFATPFTGAFLPGLPAFPAGGTRQVTSRSWDAFTPKATLEYHPAQHLFLYATYSQGFKSGGFNVGNVQPAFAPEKLTDFEAGIKADWLDGRLRTNLAAFNYDYADLQVSKVNGTVVTIENAASARLRGIEAEVIALPVRNLRLEGNVSLLHSEYRDYVSVDPSRAPLGPLNLTGNRLTQAPRYTINLAAEYKWDLGAGSLTARAEGNWVDRVYFTPFNTAAVSQAPHSVFNAFLTYTSPHKDWTANAYVRNIGNERTVATAFIGSGLVGFPIVGAFDPPRLYGASLTYHY